MKSPIRHNQEMNDLQQAINKLKSSLHYQKLATYKPPFDPFEVMGVPYRERSHSKVLGWLLSDEANREFRQEFVSWIVNGLDNYNPNVGANESPDITCKCEHGDNEAGRIDVFAHFPDIKLAVAIEVKVRIRQGEQDSQIGRYQCFLNREYPNCMKVVIFLTPSGEASKTEDPGTGVVVLNMSWDQVARIIDNMRPEQGNENDFRVQFRNHLRRVIVMNEKEEKRIVRELLCEGDNAKILQPILDYLPMLQDFSEEWKKIVAKVCKVEDPGSLKVETHALQHVVRELKIKVPEWCDAGLPFTLMLYKYETAIGVRILLHKDDYGTHEEKLHDFAKSSNGIVNGEFPPADNWRAWRTVLADDSSVEEPLGTVIDAETFYHDEKWKKEVKEKLEKQMSKLLEPIKNQLAE